MLQLLFLCCIFITHCHVLGYSRCNHVSVAMHMRGGSARDKYGYEYSVNEQRGPKVYNQSTRQWGNRYKQRNKICRKLEIPTGYGPMHYAPYAPEGQERYLGANVHDRGVRKQYDGPVERGQSGNKQEWWRQVDWPAGCCSRENMNERERGSGNSGSKWTGRRTV